MEPEPKALDSWIPPDDLGFPKVGDGTQEDDHIVRRYGNTTSSAGAQRELRNAILNSHLEVRLPLFVHQVLELPPGWRTRIPLDGIPIGLLVYMISRESIRKFGNDHVLGSLVLVGGVTRFKNRVVLGAPAPNKYLNQEDTMYAPKIIGKDVDSFFFQSIPLDRIHFDYLF